MDLDAAYANAEFIPDAAAYPPRWAIAAEAFRGVWPTARLDIAYGSHPRERMDLFLPAARPVGLLIFVHGGYWRRFGKSDWSQFAAGGLAAGWAVALPGYPLCPEVRISGITQSIARAVTELAGAVAGPIRLCGHSAGGHLVARMPSVLEPDIAGRIARIVPISPVSDLRPLLRTEINADLNLTAEEAASESPMLSPAPDGPVSVWVGAEERPAFLDQARWLAEAWSARHHIAPGCHHFDVIDGLTDPESPLMRSILA